MPDIDRRARLPPFSIARRIGSFRHALRGIATLVRTQHNAWLHLVATGLALACGAYFSLACAEWVAVVLAIGLVWLAEALNTAVEFLADEVSLAESELIREAKDAAAGGVLVAAVGALVVGILVFAPHQQARWHG
jgi:diacylglycerol kinase